MVGPEMLMECCHGLSECSTGVNVFFHNGFLNITWADTEPLIEGEGGYGGSDSSANERRQKILDAAMALNLWLVRRMKKVE